MVETVKWGSESCRMPVERRLWERVKRGNDDECWPWFGSVNAGGYGRLAFRGSNWLAHRVSYTLLVGEIPDGLVMRHTCDNPPCCNPKHLITGTRYENNWDRFAKHGIHLKSRGEESPCAKVTEQHVREMRVAYAAGGIRQKDLAAKYGLAEQTVGHIISRRRWSHVS